MKVHCKVPKQLIVYTTVPFIYDIILQCMNLYELWYVIDWEAVCRPGVTLLELLVAGDVFGVRSIFRQGSPKFPPYSLRVTGVLVYA